MEENNLYTMVRGVRIPTVQIDMVEQGYGVKLVTDEEPNLLKALDLTLQKHRLTHDNNDPDVILLREYPEWVFKHMVLNIEFLGTMIPGAYNKPAWFRFKKNF